MTRSMRGGIALAVLLLSACVATLPQPGETPAPAPGIVLPAPAQTGGDITQGGAVGVGQHTGEPVPLPPETRPPLSPNLPKSIEGSGAATPVISLVKAARASLASGRTDQAGASLERAMRIEPRNPWVWQSLAALHVVTQQGEQAESEAKKSISLGKRNPYLDVENWRLIAEARKIKGDKAGAAQATAKREELQALIAP